jgi:hypothetical protein
LGEETKRNHYEWKEKLEIKKERRLDILFSSWLFFAVLFMHSFILKTQYLKIASVCD